MTNVALDLVEQLASRGLYPASVVISREHDGWYVTCGYDTSIDGYEDITEIRSVQEGWQTQRQRIDEITDEIAESWIREIAKNGLAPGFKKTESGYPTWIAHPDAWLPEPLRSRRIEASRTQGHDTY